VKRLRWRFHQPARLRGYRMLSCVLRMVINRSAKTAAPFCLNAAGCVTAMAARCWIQSRTSLTVARTASGSPRSRPSVMPSSWTILRPLQSHRYGRGPLCNFVRREGDKPLNRFKQHEDGLGKAQRRLSRKKKISKNWKRARVRVQRIQAIGTRRIGSGLTRCLARAAVGISGR
jgi:hypothetical protein